MAFLLKRQTIISIKINAARRRETRKDGVFSCSKRYLSMGKKAVCLSDVLSHLCISNNKRPEDALSSGLNFRTCLHNSKRSHGGDFPAGLRQFPLEYTKYSCEKFLCPAEKSLAMWSFLAYEDRFLRYNYASSILLLRLKLKFIRLSLNCTVSTTTFSEKKFVISH